MTTCQHDRGHLVTPQTTNELRFHIGFGEGH
jgi:hypothetical protein